MTPSEADQRLRELADRALKMNQRISLLTAHYMARYGDNPQNRAMVNLLGAQKSFAEAVDYIGRALYHVQRKQ